MTIVSCTPKPSSNYQGPSVRVPFMIPWGFHVFSPAEGPFSFVSGPWMQALPRPSYRGLNNENRVPLKGV